MPEDAERLTVKDAESAQKAILELILKYPNYPKTFKASNATIKWNNIETTTSIGIFSLQGAKYLKKYISGSYRAQMPFQVVSRSSPTANRDSIAAQELVDSIGAWLEENGISFKDEHMQFELINRTSPAFLLNQNDKVVDYAINVQLKYFYKK